MSKTIIFSILGASVIAYVVISKDSSELSTNELNSANSSEQRQGAISYKDNEATVPAQSAIGQPEFEPIDDTELLNANKINSPDQENKQETNENGFSPEQPDASAKKIDPENIQAGPYQSINNIDTGAHTLNNKTSDEQEVSAITSNISGLSNNQADDGTSTETSGDEEDDSNTEETSDVDDNDADRADDADDDSDDDKTKPLVGNWSGTMTANGNDCKGADIYISLYDSPPQYFLGGSVQTFPGHLNIDDNISYEIIGSVTYKGKLSAKLTQIFPGTGVSDYQVDYDGSLSGTKGDGSWSDNRSCSGAWSINKY
jgi:hypothetical protein